MEATLNYVPANKDILLLKLEPFQVFELDKLLGGTIDPLKFDGVRLWRDQCNTYPTDWELGLAAANSIMKESGVEVLVEDGRAIASYVNNGDTYKPTVIYDHENEEFLITSWGDFLEGWKSENVIEIDCEDVANDIYNISHSSSVEWAEWIEGRPEDYDTHEDYLEAAFVDIRLQVTEDNGYYVRWGLSDFDQDHRGAWGAASVGKCVSMENCKAIAKDLIEQAAESADCNLTKTVRAYNDD